ncbi:MAG: SLC13 family permease [Proteobacteria bacterium]|nr:SLC13 family permease [Pseudomonadota bacterium]
MSAAQAAILLILLAALVLFFVGRWRYDLVAFGALIAGVLAGVVPAADAFLGFGHPAVVTVAMVLVISRALAHSGALDPLARRIAPLAARPALHVTALGLVAMALSAFMNNVGALALLMPVALRTSAKAGRSPAVVLMPLAFAAILGGLITQIGTPPNIIIASVRAGVAGEPFRIFDFAPVGLAVAIAGVLFVTLVGWRLIPHRGRRAKGALADAFDIGGYVTEVRVPEGSKLEGEDLRVIEREVGEGEVFVLGLVRGERRLLGRVRFEPIRAGDVLILEANPEDLDALLKRTGLELVGDEKVTAETLRSDEIQLIEAVVAPDSPLEGQSPLGLRLRTRFGVNLLAIARQGRRVGARLRNVRFRAGDVLLLQGEEEALAELASGSGLLPLAERGVRVGASRRATVPALVFAGALALTALGLLPVAVAFSAAVALMALLRVVPPRVFYQAIDWPVIVLLGSMIPLGGALESTGATAVIARTILAGAGEVPPAMMIGGLMIATMALTDVMNNAATAVVMAPIGVDLAAALGVSPDPFLMAVAVGASCAFLTPIGHQNNTLVMGPGGYRFGDYWRMGLPLDGLVVAVAVPMILWVWPL